MNRTLIVVSHDIDRAGDSEYAPIVSIGFCVGDDKGNVILKQRFNNAVEWPTAHGDRGG